MIEYPKCCFVCQAKETNVFRFEVNVRVNLPVCWQCKDTPRERKAVKEALDSLADGFVCGCI